MYRMLSSLAVLSPASPTPEEVAGACVGCGMFILILPIAVLALHICLMVWVARDCKARGQREMVGWLILLALTGLIGLIVYLCVRPDGQMMRCAKCGRRYMKSLEACPHCRN